MNRKIRIASALALAGFLSASVSLAASAGSPLLSGYGGPGAGEQAIVGSTFLGGPHGGASSGGSTGSAGSGGAGLGGLGGTFSGAGNSTSTGGRAGSGGSSSARSPESGGASQASAKLGRAGTSAFVYPSSLRFAAASSPALGISGGDLVLLAAIIATLALVGTLTIRLARLQP